MNAVIFYALIHSNKYNQKGPTFVKVGPLKINPVKTFRLTNLTASIFSQRYSLVLLDSLKKRGLYGTLLVTSDAHGGIKAALQKELPEAAWQRCQFHFTKNIGELTPKKYQAGLRAEVNELFQAKTMKEAIEKRDNSLHRTAKWPPERWPVWKKHSKTP